MHRVSHRRTVLLVLAAGAVACGGRDAAPSHAPLTYPADVAGRWVRLREDSTWGDTLEYRVDGHVLGSVGHAVPPSARWGVRAGPLGSRELCAADADNAYCQTFRLEGATMILGGGPGGPTYFRRVP